MLDQLQNNQNQEIYVNQNDKKSKRIQNTTEDSSYSPKSNMKRFYTKIQIPQNDENDLKDRQQDNSNQSQNISVRKHFNVQFQDDQKQDQIYDEDQSENPDKYFKSQKIFNKLNQKNQIDQIQTLDVSKNLDQQKSNTSQYYLNSQQMDNFQNKQLDCQNEITQGNQQNRQRIRINSIEESDKTLVANQGVFNLGKVNMKSSLKNKKGNSPKKQQVIQKLRIKTQFNSKVQNSEQTSFFQLSPTKHEYNQQQIQAAIIVQRNYLEFKNNKKFILKPFQIELENQQLKIIDKEISLKHLQKGIQKQIKDGSIKQIKGNFQLIYYIQQEKILFIFKKRFTLSFMIQELNLKDNQKIIQFSKDMFYNFKNFLILRSNLRLEVDKQFFSYLKSNNIQFKQLNYVDYFVHFQNNQSIKEQKIIKQSSLQTNQNQNQNQQVKKLNTLSDIAQEKQEKNSKSQKSGENVQETNIVLSSLNNAILDQNKILLSQMNNFESSEQDQKFINLEQIMSDQNLSINQYQNQDLQRLLFQNYFSSLNEQYQQQNGIAKNLENILVQNEIKKTFYDQQLSDIQNQMEIYLQTKNNGFQNEESQYLFENNQIIQNFKNVQNYQQNQNYLQILNNLKSQYDQQRQDLENQNLLIKDFYKEFQENLSQNFQDVSVNQFFQQNNEMKNLQIQEQDQKIYQQNSIDQDDFDISLDKQQLNQYFNQNFSQISNQTYLNDIYQNLAENQKQQKTSDFLNQSLNKYEGQMQKFQIKEIQQEKIQQKLFYTKEQNNKSKIEEVLVEDKQQKEVNASKLINQDQQYSDLIKNNIQNSEEIKEKEKVYNIQSQSNQISKNSLRSSMQFKKSQVKTQQQKKQIEQAIQNKSKNLTQEIILQNIEQQNELQSLQQKLFFNQIESQISVFLQDNQSPEQSREQIIQSENNEKLLQQQSQEIQKSQIQQQNSEIKQEQLEQIEKQSSQLIINEIEKINLSEQELLTEENFEVQTVLIKFCKVLTRIKEKMEKNYKKFDAKCEVFDLIYENYTLESELDFLRQDVFQIQSEKNISGYEVNIVYNVQNEQFFLFCNELLVKPCFLKFKPIHVPGIYHMQNELERRIRLVQFKETKGLFFTPPDQDEKLDMCIAIVLKHLFPFKKKQKKQSFLFHKNIHKIDKNFKVSIYFIDQEGNYQVTVKLAEEYNFFIQIQNYINDFDFLCFQLSKYIDFENKKMKEFPFQILVGHKQVKCIKNNQLMMKCMYFQATISIYYIYSKNSFLIYSGNKLLFQKKNLQYYKKQELKTVARNLLDRIFIAKVQTSDYFFYEQTKDYKFNLFFNKTYLINGVKIAVKAIRDIHYMLFNIETFVSHMQTTVLTYFTDYHNFTKMDQFQENHIVFNNIKNIYEIDKAFLDFVEYDSNEENNINNYLKIKGLFNQKQIQASFQFSNPILQCQYQLQQNIDCKNYKEKNFQIIEEQKDQSLDEGQIIQNEPCYQFINYQKMEKINKIPTQRDLIENFRSKK